MSLDTKYRPSRYSDVLGQSGTIKVLKELVRKGHGFRQSCLFGGPWGSGKTTLARIFARALLCEHPNEGEPCDECRSCKTMLSRPGSHECFVEVDAATNSGKENIARIVEDLQYNTFSGKQRIYLFDECHEMSRQAFDAMLLPMENNRPGSEDKVLVCLFCTTEPEKMRPAVVSRCAPAFTIRACTPQQIADRLETICQTEEIPYEKEALPLIAEITECHIRDALKAIEGVSMLGSVSVANVSSYLNVDVHNVYLDLLDGIGTDLSKVLSLSESLFKKVSPSTAYEQLAEMSLLCYRVAKLSSQTVPGYLSLDKLKAIGERHGEFLIEITSRLSKRPYRTSSSMLACDLISLHQLATGAVPTIVRTETPIAYVSAPSASAEVKTQLPASNFAPSVSSVECETKVPDKGYVTSDGCYVDPRAQRSLRDKLASDAQKGRSMPAEVFSARLDERLQELAEEDGRPSGRGYVGSA